MTEQILTAKPFKKQIEQPTKVAIKGVDDQLIPQHSLLKSIAYHLIPGILLTVAYLVTAPLAQTLGFPPVTALLLCVLFILVPFALWHFWRSGGGKFQLEGVIFYREKLPLRQYFIWVPVLLVWSFLMWGLATPLDNFVSQHLLSWLPNWFDGLITDFTGYSRPVLWFTVILSLLVNGLIAPVIEELYFRGYLMPRLSRYGWLAPLVGTILFTVYHFWQPMNYFKIGLAMLPWIYLAWRKQSIGLAIAVHCALNLTGAIATFALVLG